jgi:hypothetical protein
MRNKVLAAACAIFIFTTTAAAQQFDGDTTREEYFNQISDENLKDGYSDVFRAFDFGQDGEIGQYDVLDAISVYRSGESDEIDEDDTAAITQAFKRELTFDPDSGESRVSIPTYNGRRRSAYTYTGDEQDEFEDWQNGDSSTRQFVRDTERGEGLASVTLGDDLVRRNPDELETES